MNASEQFLEVVLDHSRVLRLAENLEQIVVADEVEARELAALVCRCRDKMKNEDGSRAERTTNEVDHVGIKLSSLS